MNRDIAQVEESSESHGIVNMGRQANSAPSDGRRAGAAWLEPSEMVTVEAVLERRGWSVSSPDDPKSFVHSPVDLLIVQASLSDSPRLQAITDLREALGQTSVILAISPRTDIASVETLICAGVDDIVPTGSGEEVLEARCALAEQALAGRQKAAATASAPVDNEAGYRALFEFVPCGIYESLPEGRFVRVNSVLAQILGYETAEQLLEVDIPQDLYINPETRQKLLAELDEAGETVGQELEFKRRDGSRIVLLEHAVVRRDAAGQVRSYLGTLSDITDREADRDRLRNLAGELDREIARKSDELECVSRRLEQRKRQLENAQLSLARSETRYRSLVEHLNEAVFQVDRGGRLEFVNRAFERMAMAPASELVGREITDILHDPRDTDILRMAGRQTGTSEAPSDLELLAADGSLLCVRASLSPVVGDDTTTGYQGTLTDITAQRSAERRHRLSEEHFRRLVENLTEVIYRVDVDGTITYLNPAAEQLFGRPPKELIGSHFSEVVWPEDLDGRLRNFERLMDGKPVRSEFRIVHREEQVREVLNSIVPVVVDGRIASIQGVLTDVTGRKRVERELERAESLLRGSLRAIPAGAVVVDADANVILVNDAAVEILGIPDRSVIRRSDRGQEPRGWWMEDPERGELDPHEEPLSRALNTGHVTRSRSLTVHRADGTRCSILVNATPVRSSTGEIMAAIGVFADVTRVRELEQRVGRAERMEALGQLAGGAAHDFNNLLQVIVGTVELIRRDPGLSSKSHDDLAVIDRVADTAAELSRGLLAFARRQILRRELIAAKPAVEGASKLLARLLPVNINLEVDVDAEAGPLLADRGSIEQILVNLCVNARDAMPDGGTLRLVVDDAHLDEEFFHAHPGSFVGSCSRLVVSDTGCGMDDDTIAHALEPFFTTKRGSGGTGLGLASVYGAVKQHNGYIDIESELGVGTTISVYLPKAARDLTDQSRDRASDGHPGSVADKVVLVVEDREDLRRVLSRLLQDLGATVLEANNGREAQDVILDRAGSLDLVIMDLSMPVMGGDELLPWLRTRWPLMPVIVCSGDRGSSTQARRIVEEPWTAWLDKPFELAEFEATVLQMIGNRSQPPPKD